ncbi:MAG TPA: hypothetical protein VIK91_03605 [Nannocystis sp.]
MRGVYEDILDQPCPYSNNTHPPAPHGAPDPDCNTDDYQHEAQGHDWARNDNSSHYNWSPLIWMRVFAHRLRVYSRDAARGCQGLRTAAKTTGQGRPIAAARTKPRRLARRAYGLRPPLATAFSKLVDVGNAPYPDLSQRAPTLVLEDMLFSGREDPLGVGEPG